MEPILETDRLVIRRLSEADVDALVALDSDQDDKCAAWRTYVL